MSKPLNNQKWLTKGSTRRQDRLVQTTPWKTSRFDRSVGSRKSTWETRQTTTEEEFEGVSARKPTTTGGVSRGGITWGIHQPNLDASMVQKPIHGVPSYEGGCKEMSPSDSGPPDDAWVPSSPGRRVSSGRRTGRSQGRAQRGRSVHPSHEDPAREDGAASSGDGSVMVAPTGAVTGRHPHDSVGTTAVEPVLKDSFTSHSWNDSFGALAPLDVWDDLRTCVPIRLSLLPRSMGWVQEGWVGSVCLPSFGQRGCRRGFLLAKPLELLAPCSSTRQL